MHTIVLLRHGESVWNQNTGNQEGRFTGWSDVALSNQGQQQARNVGLRMKQAGFVFDIAYTSLLKRAIHTLWLALESMDMFWLPVISSWHLNERHYGALQGLTKSEAIQQYGTENVEMWRRGDTAQPPQLLPTDPRHPSHDPRYASIPPAQLPCGESTHDVMARFMPYWQNTILATAQSGKRVLVVSHGNLLRTLLNQLDAMITGQTTKSMETLDIPPATPIVYEFDPDMKPIRRI